MLSFTEVFSTPATVVAQAPGRVNLLGEHTDYTGGFVLPIGIRQHIRALKWRPVPIHISTYIPQIFMSGSPSRKALPPARASGATFMDVLRC